LKNKKQFFFQIHSLFATKILNKTKIQKQKNMKKISFLLTMVLAGIMMFNTSCTKDDEEETTPVKKPVAAFTAGSTTVEVGERVWFTDNSTNSPSSRMWLFEDADPATSTNSKSSTIWDAAGTYDVTLIVENSAGIDTLVKEDYITVEVPEMSVKFHNPLFTDISVTVTGSWYYQTATIEPGDSYSFADLQYGAEISYSAKTSGKTSSGQQLGLEISWSENSIVLEEVLDIELSAGSTYFFLNITNSGSGSLNNLWVNYGLSTQMYDNILLPNDGNKYKIGYYKAFSNSNVRMYFQSNPSSYVYWDQGTHFNLSWTDNQQANLGNTNKSAGLFGENTSIDGITIEAEAPDYSNIPENAITKYPVK
jgi:PKD repeat protein